MLPKITKVLVLVCCCSYTNAQITIQLQNPSGTYATGETAHWVIQMDEETQIDSVQYSLKKGGLTLLSGGPLAFTNRMANLQHRFTEPGAVLLEVRWKQDGSWEKTVGGAIADPEDIPLSAEKPNDFDAFWKEQIERLAQIPKQVRLQPFYFEQEPELEYYHITMRNIAKSHIQGQLAKPAAAGKLPALLIVQWAGVYPLQPDWVLEKAKEGWLVLNINAHDLPIDREPDFYAAKREGPLKDYPNINNDERHESYFLRMYLSCYRAAQYLSEHPDWDGETLVVMGTSQGGLQSLVTAGIHPKITAAMALVPAGFDTMGPVVGRKDGWPHWYANTKGKDSTMVHETSSYFDVANFIPNITCPVLVGIGLLDETCPPSGIYAGMNQLKTYKELLLLPRSGHQAKNGSQDAYYARLNTHWLPRLRDRLPIKKQ